ncbi:MAG TPA: hypothetical protein VJ144_08660 [Candidatus Polarisedimenticolia bacterium]|nr:hypothetical protein [Candidatus Polarisedimenticolia bacterium]
MRRAFRMSARFLLIAAVVTAAAVLFAPPSRSSSPYVSALSDLAASPAYAAKKQNCGTACEFVAPAFTCLGESPGSRCVRTTSGCTTQAC